METKAKIRGKYKKHTEGFKIAVDYKLNTRLQGIRDVEGADLLYPVYVEVRARRQSSYFRSFYNFYVSPAKFDAFLRTDIVQSLLSNESDQIKSDLEAFDNLSEEFIIKDWLNNFRKHESSRLININLNSIFCNKFLTNQANQERVRESFGKLIEQNTFIEPSLNLAVILREVTQSMKYDEIIDILQTYLRVDDEIASYSRDWLSDVDAFLYLQHSMTGFTMFENEPLNKRLLLVYQGDAGLFDDINKLKIYLEKNKKFC